MSAPLVFKHGQCRIQGMDPVMWFAIEVGRQVFFDVWAENAAEIGDCPEFVITEVMPTTPHSWQSLHNSGRAIDVRSWNFPEHLRAMVLQLLQDRLGDLGFDVIYERPGRLGEHYHIEYQPTTDHVLVVKEEAA